MRFHGNNKIVRDETAASEISGNLIAMLGAFCLFLSAIEYMIPKPLPFFRIGLANLPLMLALDILPFPSFFILVCIKAFGQALITGTLFSYIFLFSITGTFLSALLMFFLRRSIGKDRITFIGIGTAGALVSNVSQLVLAYVFIFRESVRYIAPPFLLTGFVTGIVLGIFCEIFIQKSQWYKKCEGAVRRDEANREDAPENGESNHKTVVRFECAFTAKFYRDSFSANALFITGLFIMPALLFNPVTEYRIVQFLFFWFLAYLCGKKTNAVFTVLVIIFIIIFNLLIPYGRVLFSIGMFKITIGALEAGVHRAVTLQGLVMLSKAAIRQDLMIPGMFGKMLGESLRIFSELIGRKYRVTGKNIFTEIDNLLLELQGKEYKEIPSSEKSRTKLAGYIILAVIIIVSWVPFFAGTVLGIRG